MSKKLLGTTLSADGLCLTLNGDAYVLTNRASEEFIGRIAGELVSGFGFVPLVGAGFSAPSGIPLVHQLKSYLQRCICFALGAEESGMRPWNPRHDNWPPFIDPRRPEMPRYFWENLVYNEFTRQRLSEPDHPNLAIFQEGYGAMAEWRTALLFLSRLIRIPDDKEDFYHGRLILGEPKQEIIDACFREVLRGKHPSLNHHILSALSGLLRIDVVLSTNFDDLLERAFQASRNPLDVFEVHLEGGLPDWSTVSRVRALVKLHGSKYLLRADYSLDGEPSELDKEHFLEYLMGRPVDDQGFGSNRSSRHSVSAQGNHLLVMGVSAAERRTCAFIHHAWRNLHHFTVYWICYSNRDVQNARDFTESFYSASKAELSPRKVPLSVILRHTDVGLLLMQLYQNVRKNIPPTGTLFPSVSRVAQPPLGLDSAASNGFSDLTNRLKRELDSFEDPAFASPEFTKYRLAVLTSDNAVRGLTAECAVVFRQLEINHVCLWIDMNDISSTDNLFEVLLEAAYVKLGLENWTPVSMSGEARARANEIRRLVSASTYPWVVFLNARETPGENTAYPGDKHSPQNNKHRPNGWLDEDEEPADEDRNKDKSAWMGPFIDLLKELCGSDQRGVSVVLLCSRDSSRQDPEIALKLFSTFGVKPIVLGRGDAARGRVPKVDKTAEDSIAWTLEPLLKGKPKPAELDEVRERQAFLHALLLFQRSRLAATVWDPCVSLQLRGTQAGKQYAKSDWLAQLEDIGLLRRKQGGYIWVHSRCRTLIRGMLHDQAKTRIFAIYRNSIHGKSSVATLARRLATEWHPTRIEHDIHIGIAEWYQKVLLATGSPSAVFEAAEHFCRAAEATLRDKKGSLEKAGAALRKAAALVGRNSYLIQTHGYSRGSCRKLEYLRDFIFKLRNDPHFSYEPANALDALNPDVLSLQLVCADAMRAIAREVGEDKRAYQRHRELRGWMIGLQPKDHDSDKNNCHGLATVLQARLTSLRNKHIHHKSEADLKDDASKLRQQWLRYWRWSGMLGIASRSEKAESALAKGLATAIRFSQTNTLESHEPILNPSDKQIRSLTSVLTKIPEPSPLEEPRGLLRRERVEILRIIEECAAFLLTEEYAVRRLLQLRNTDNGTQTKQDKNLLSNDKRKVLNEKLRDNGRIARVKELVKTGLRLASFTIAEDNRGSSYHTMAAMWCRSRLLIHLSSAHAFSPQARFDQALSTLGDAESSLNMADQRRLRSDKALVDLHRGNIRLVQANSIPLEWVDKANSPQQEPVKFRDVCLKLLRQRLNLPALKKTDLDEKAGSAKESPLERQRTVLQREHFGDLDAFADRIREIKSLSYDAMRFLDRAEPVLRERRRNVWWTTWYFEKRLRTIATLAWTSVFERGVPIPYLGLEAAMRKTNTEADTLLDDSIRMIRVDAYRLASVVHAYALCARALQLRLLWDGSTPALPDRLTTMRDNLLRGVNALDNVLRLRIAPEEDKREKKKKTFAFCPVSHAYVIDVMDECTATADALRLSLPSQ